MTHFEKYMHITMIADIQTRVDKIGKELAKHCRKNFRDLAKVNIFNIAAVLSKLFFY